MEIQAKKQTGKTFNLAQQEKCMKEIKGNTGKKTNRKNVEFSFWSYMEFIYRLKFLFH